MPSRRTEFSRSAVRWLLPSALLALAPKCLLCVLAYAGLGGAFGFGGPEICGASDGWIASSATSLAWFGAAGVLALVAPIAIARAKRGACCEKPASD